MWNEAVAKPLLGTIYSKARNHSIMVWKLDTTVDTLVPQAQSCGEAPAACALVQLLAI